MAEIKEHIPKKKFAIIVAIEQYRQGTSTISSVKYAQNDATAFKQLLLNHFGYDDSEIKMFINHEAVCATFENDIQYFIKQLSSEYQFIFYYVGHGFYQDNFNKLTCWDSHPFNLSETSVSIKDVLLDPLAASGCEQSLIFLDCCSSYLKDFLSRDVIADMNLTEFESFVSNSTYNAIFMSCSPGEKSYSSDALQHGIWTWHLIKALSGDENSVIVNDYFITDSTLRNYLGYAVPKFVVREKDVKGTQRPYAKIHAGHDFLIRQLPKPISQIDSSLPDFKLKYQEAVFRKIDYEKIKDAQGFKSNYKTPKWFNSRAVEFVQEVFAPEIKQEVQDVYEKTKTVCNLKKSDIEYGSHLSGGSVECMYFRYHVDVDLEEDNLSKAKITRKLQLLVKRDDLPEDLDSIFPIYLDELVVPIEGNIDFDDIVNKFENLKESQGGSVRDNQELETMEYITDRGTSITIDVANQELIITHYSPQRTLDLIDKSIEDLKRISSHKINLLGG